MAKPHQDHQEARQALARRGQGLHPRELQQHHRHHHRHGRQHRGLVELGLDRLQGLQEGHPYAAQLAAADATRKAQNMGLSQLDIVIRGTGSGREQAIRSIQATGVNVRTIIDDTPTPHNGCRLRKRRRQK
jgi:hypothetical protein